MTRVARPLALLAGVLAVAAVAGGMTRPAGAQSSTTLATPVTVAVQPAPPVPTTAPVATGIGSLTDLKRSTVLLFDRSDAFREVAFRVVRTADGKVLLRGCALLATTEAQHNQGLMRRKDLAGYDAMLFWFPQPVQALFYMKTVPMDLSIAWFDGAGSLVGKADMKKQGDCGDSCPLYGPDAPYRTALEVRKGGLARLQVGPSTRLVYGGRCTVSPTRR